MSSCKIFLEKFLNIAYFLKRAEVKKALNEVQPAGAKPTVYPNERLGRLFESRG